MVYGIITTDKRGASMLRKNQTSAGFTILELVVVIGAILLVSLIIMFMSAGR